MLLDPVQVNFDHEVSEYLARRVRAQHRRCWRNAVLAVSHLGPGAHYVEGWVVTSGRRPHVIEHGWCEQGDRIIDPTYVPQVTPDMRPVGYFGGLRFSVRQAEVGLHKRLPLAWGRESRDYWMAFERAWRHATQQANLPAAPAPRTRVVHCRQEPFDVFIGRPTDWASPFHIGPDGSRAEVVAKYCHWLIRHPGQLRDVWTLRGRALGCRCAPQVCHGDVLARLADVETVEPGTLLIPWT